jgi:hypothetical protein
MYEIKFFKIKPRILIHGMSSLTQNNFSTHIVYKIRPYYEKYNKALTIL